MKNTDKQQTLQALKEVRACMEQSVAYDQCHIDAVDEAIKALDTTSDLDVINGTLFLLGAILSAVAVVSAVCGLIYCWFGGLEMAGALLPYVAVPAAAALAALWLAKR